MRNSLVGWFVLGMFLPLAVGGVGACLYCTVIGLNTPWTEQVRTVLAIALTYMLVRFLGSHVSFAARVPRRHRLFTPLYDQRPHEWTSRLA